MKICSVEGCENTHKAKGLCDKHYARKLLSNPEYRRKRNLAQAESYHNLSKNKKEKKKERRRVRDVLRYHNDPEYRKTKRDRIERSKHFGSTRLELIQYLYIKQKAKCGICGELLQYSDDLHIDHIIPVNKNGKNELSNFQLAHAFCNMSKGNSIISIMFRKRRFPFKEVV